MSSDPGGVFVGSVPNVYNLRSRLFFLARPPAGPRIRRTSTCSRRAAVAALLSGFDDVELEFFGGRFIRLHARLLSWDIAFRGTRRP